MFARLHNPHMLNSYNRLCNRCDSPLHRIYKHWTVGPTGCPTSRMISICLIHATSYTTVHVVLCPNSTDFVWSGQPGPVRVRVVEFDTKQTYATTSYTSGWMNYANESSRAAQLRSL